MLKNPFIAFLKLIRIENLIIIALTQFSIQFFVLTDFTDYSTFPASLFFISLLSTALIAAAGYIINDYFDDEDGTDKVNKEFIAPFSGGSRLLQTGVLTRREILAEGIVFFAFAALCLIFVSLKTSFMILAAGMTGMAFGIF